MSAADLRQQLRERGLQPHQVEFVEAAIASSSGGRILLADDVGLGKTEACINLAWALGKELDRTPRTLILAPRALLARWQTQLRELGVADPMIVDAAAFRHLEARTRVDENPWMIATTALTSIDFAKQENRLSSLVQATWDLVIFEEAQLARARSERGRAMRALWGARDVALMVAVSAMPHTGYADDFEPFSDPRTTIIRRRARELRDWAGQPLVPDAAEQIVDVVKLDLSREETTLLKAVNRLLDAPPSSDGRHHFFLRILAQRAASSVFALEQTVRRALTRGRDGHPKYEELDDQLVLFDSEDALDETPPAVPHEQLRSLLDLVDRIEVDSKWQACAEILQREVADRATPAILFCEFTDTAEYLTGLLDSLNCSVGVVTGATDGRERQRVFESFRDQGGVLVLTSAASEGLQLAFVKLCVHYDLPWSAARLAQRLGRVQRYGAPPGSVRHVFFADGLFITERLVRKICAFHVGDADVSDIQDLFAGMAQKEDG